MNYKTCLPLAALVLHPLFLLTQMPSQPGTMVIRSVPPGANVTINGKAASQPTDLTLVVTAGTYSVSVEGEANNPHCGATSINVAPGQTVIWLCSDKGWVKQSK